MKALLALFAVAVPVLVLAADVKWLAPTCTSAVSTCKQTSGGQTENAPTSTTPGVNLFGKCGARVTVFAGLTDAGTDDESQTLSGGSVKLWHKSALAGARWAVNQTAITQTADTSSVVVLDGVVPAPTGRLYVQAYDVDSVTNDGGAGTVHVSVELTDCPK